MAPNRCLEHTRRRIIGAPADERRRARLTRTLGRVPGRPRKARPFLYCLPDWRTAEYHRLPAEVAASGGWKRTGAEATRPRFLCDLLRPGAPGGRSGRCLVKRKPE